jgi:hypothetical protein
VCDSVAPTNAEMLVPAVARDVGEGRIVVTLQGSRLAACGVHAEGARDQAVLGRALGADLP